MDDFSFQDDLSPRHQYTLDDALTSLEDDPTKMGAAISYGLSDVLTEQEQKLKTALRKIDTEERQELLKHLIGVSEANFELNYRTVAFLSLDDPDENIRARAIELLWEDETLELLDWLVEAVQWDASDVVRAAAANAIGRFVLLGEYGKLPQSHITKAQDAVVAIWHNEDENENVRRRALEAISNSSHPVVPEAIEDAYHSGSHRLLVSSIYAMGRSCDDRWASVVLKELGSDDPQIRYEAARASGELELESSIRMLAKLALMGDRDIQEVAIWSIGEIGGDQAIRVLERLQDELDEEEWAESIDDAIANANLGHGIPELFDFLDDLS